VSPQEWARIFAAGSRTATGQPPLVAPGFVIAKVLEAMQAEAEAIGREGY
jgi:hypothetical protein